MTTGNEKKILFYDLDLTKCSVREINMRTMRIPNVNLNNLMEVFYLQPLFMDI